ncbi:MAG: FAD-binding oxidoreductase [Planctomycetes bacterium]|nr:FAD-binding oxidoreductase [Planctomycetota bacterium]
MTPPQRAQTVIVGGGAVGCAVAYSLAEAGRKDVLVLEKEESLAAQTTSQAAGLVGQVRSTVEEVKLLMWSAETFERLQADSPESPAWRQVGSLRVAHCDERIDELKNLKTVADEAGLETEFIDNDRARELWPLMTFEGVKAVLWCPSDGYVQPYDLTMSYAAEGRKLGVEFRTGVRVSEVKLDGGRVTGVETDQGDIECEMVINAAGAFAYQLAGSVGIELPIFPVRHEFFVTIDCEGIEPTLPVVRIPDSSIYVRSEVNSILVGGWETGSLSTDPRTVPLSGEQPLVEEDWEVLEFLGENVLPQVPAINELGIRHISKGWPTFTPDGRFIIGESSKVKGFVMAGGCNAHGISGSAGIGRHLVESLIESDPSPYVKNLSPDRFDGNWDWNEARRQAQLMYESYYGLPH